MAQPQLSERSILAGRIRVEREVLRHDGGRFIIGHDLDRATRVWAMPIDPAVPEQAYQRLKDQWTTLLELKPSPVPDLIGFEETKNERVGVFRYEEGESLANRLARGSHGALEAIDVVHQCIDSLLLSHRMGIAHGALRPEVIHFGGDGKMLVLAHGLEAMTRSPADLPRVEDDLRALGLVAARALDGLGEGETALERRLEKIPHLPAQARSIILDLVDSGSSVDPDEWVTRIDAVRRRLAHVVTPVRPTPSDDGKDIKVLLRLTVEAFEDTGDASEPKEDRPPALTARARATTDIMMPPEKEPFSYGRFFALVMAGVLALMLIRTFACSGESPVKVERLSQLDSVTQ